MLLYTPAALLSSIFSSFAQTAAYPAPQSGISPRQRRHFPRTYVQFLPPAVYRSFATRFFPRRGSSRRARTRAARILAHVCAYSVAESTPYRPRRGYFFSLPGVKGGGTACRDGGIVKPLSPSVSLAVRPKALTKKPSPAGEGGSRRLTDEACEPSASSTAPRPSLPVSRFHSTAQRH